VKSPASKIYNEDNISLNLAQALHAAHTYIYAFRQPMLFQIKRHFHRLNMCKPVITFKQEYMDK